MCPNVCVGEWGKYYKYEDRQVNCHAPSKKAKTRAEAKVKGKEMCLSALKPGMFLAVQVERERDHFWVARALNVGDDTCFYRKNFKEGTKINKTSYTPGHTCIGT